MRRPASRGPSTAEHLQVEVGPGEAAQDHLGRRLFGAAPAPAHRFAAAVVRAVGRGQRPAEPADDLVARVGGRRRGAGEDPGRPEPRERGADAQVVGPEVVPPLDDAVRLIDGDEREPARGERLEEPVEGEALGRGVDELVLAAAEGGEAAAVLVARRLDAMNVAGMPRASRART